MGERAEGTSCRLFFQGDDLRSSGERAEVVEQRRKRSDWNDSVIAF